MQSILIKVFLPLSLFIIMLGMGLGLTISDFTRVFKTPKAIVVGLFSQMIGLPILGFATCYLFDLQAELAIGLMILALCPGGVVSNVYSYLADADVGLSISLTAITGLISPFSVPLLGALAISLLAEQNQNFELDILKTIGTLVAIVILPVIIGMVIRHFKPKSAEIVDKPMKIFSSASLIIIIAAIVYDVGDDVPRYLRLAGPASIFLNILSMILGFATAYFLRLSRKQSITISLEVGLQNAATAILITGTILNNTTMAITPSAYGFLMFFTAAGAAVFAHKFFKNHPEEAA